MVSQLMGAFFRALMMVFLVALPGVLIPGIPAESTQFAALMALFAGGMIFFEYASHTPVMVEFRDAPPYNRTRFTSLLLIVFLLSVLMRGAVLETPLAGFVYAVGVGVGHFLDFSYSPVRLMVLMLPDNMPSETVAVIRASAGISYVLSLLTIGAFFLATKVFLWPGRSSAFNVLMNLPMFDPTFGQDVVVRLSRKSKMNIIMGVLLPFFIPGLIKILGPLIDPMHFQNAQTVVWIVALWAFIPASVLMRGIALGRLVGIIECKRRERYEQALNEDGFYAPA